MIGNDGKIRILNKVCRCELDSTDSEYEPVVVFMNIVMNIQVLPKVGYLFTS
jgi:hypothetical protein